MQIGHDGIKRNIRTFFYLNSAIRAKPFINNYISRLKEEGDFCENIATTALFGTKVTLNLMIYRL